MWTTLAFSLTFSKTKPKFKKWQIKGALNHVVQVPLISKHESPLSWRSTVDRVNINDKETTVTLTRMPAEG